MGSLVAGVLAAAGLELADAKKGGNGKGRGRGKGKGKGRGKGKEKVLICHRNGAGFNLISVSESAVSKHEAHGDAVCEPGPCETGVATGCKADGTCTFSLAAANTDCIINGAVGKCDAAGVCIV